MSLLVSVVMVVLVLFAGKVLLGLTAYVLALSLSLVVAFLTV